MRFQKIIAFSGNGKIACKRLFFTYLMRRVAVLGHVFGEIYKVYSGLKM